jgi:hypothetical protein
MDKITNEIDLAIAELWQQRTRAVDSLTKYEGRDKDRVQAYIDGVESDILKLKSAKNIIVYAHGITELNKMLDKRNEVLGDVKI